jgi:excisionase family DNA binding protein
MARRARMAIARPAGPAPPPGPPPDRLATVAEAAAYLHVRPRWIYDRVELHAIPYYRVGKYLRFDLAALAAAMATVPEA